MIIDKMSAIKLEGIADCWLLSVDGTRRHVGIFKNCFTNNFLERTLRTVLQVSGGGDKLGAGSGESIVRLLYCSGDIPVTCWNADVANIEGNGTFAGLSDISTASSYCYATDTAAWTNAGSDITITYLATSYANAVGKDGIYNVIDITDTLVQSTQTFTVNYTWRLYYDSAEYQP